MPRLPKCKRCAAFRSKGEFSYTHDWNRDLDELCPKCRKDAEDVKGIMW